MALLIDGYNLLHASDIISASGTLEASRQALLEFLAETLQPRELREATIVFDASDAPPGLPQLLHHRGLTVRFAPRHEDADALIEQLIEDCLAPKFLTVVSSDHRLHRAARRRKAKAIDSEIWYSERVRLLRSRSAQAEPALAKPSQPPSPEEVEFWLKEFEDASGRKKRKRDEKRR